ncbi:MAG: hypothetical protein Q9164_003000 [Protoblastenia rupestris]
MQNGTENGFQEHHVNHQQDIFDNTSATNEPEINDASYVNGHSYIENQNFDQDRNGTETPPSKRRKLTGPETSKGQRPISPPWKRVQVLGPSTFVEGGIRKSARTNYVPIDLQPQSDKRKTRGAIQHGKPPVIHSKYGGASVNTSAPVTPASTQIFDDQNGHRHAYSTGKPSVILPPKSPGRPKSIHVESSQPSIATQTPPKRSHKKKISQPKVSPSASQTPPNFPQRRPVGRPRSTTTTSHILHAPASNGWHHNDGSPSEEAEENVRFNPPVKKQRLSLRFSMPPVGIQHPEHVLRRSEITDGDQKRPKFSSFEDWLNKEGRLGLEGEFDPHIADEGAQREANLRRRISEAAKPGGVLSKEKCEYWQPEKFDPPPRLYTHQDRLLAHAAKFQGLMQQEKTKHLKAARECAQQAAAVVRSREERNYHEWKKDQPKTAAEMAQEQYEAFKAIYDQLREDISKKWLMVAEIVEDVRLQRWQAEQDRLGKEALNEAIEKSRGLLNRRRRRRASESGSDDESQDDGSLGSQGSAQSGSGEESEDEDNMSSSQSESEEGQAVGDDDEGLTQEQLRQKYKGINVSELENPPSHDQTVSTAFKNSPTIGIGDYEEASSAQHVAVALEEVADTLMDDSDESTDMDDDTGSSDENASGEDQSSNEQSEDDAGLGALGGFLSKIEREEIAKQPEDEDKPIMQSQLIIEEEQFMEGEDSDDEAEKVSLIPDVTQAPTPSASTSEEPLIQVPNIGLEATTTDPGDQGAAAGKHRSNIDSSTEEAEKEYSKDVLAVDSQMHDVELPATPISTQALKILIPSLLRGTLREYQHHGLDWLAGLYANGTNGILADEMGLGKTIQTIALLAHLAVHYEAWGPHLVIVPTSVMLNWEMEFKKFLPGFKVLAYYGTQEERKRKRTGWMDDDKWNVWITSYTLITQDQQVFKRKAWHYMILDEAHNIKNFQSLRWQTLLTFKTKARLLLTGTPLQNNLTELWSLLYFLMPSDNTGAGIAGFTNLEDFTGWFKKPTEQILEQGHEKLDDEARVAVAKLHDILRPYLLRRLKADVEKQMPGKYEHVVFCRLSKRQRYLYDGFMSRAQTRETLATGNSFSIMNALMQLRKVCNHPDLFETRQIVTSFAMPKSAVADFEIKELLVRRRLLQEDPITTVDLNLVNLFPGANEEMSALDTIQRQRIGALESFRQFASQQRTRFDWDMNFDGSSVNSALKYFENDSRRVRYQRLCTASYMTSFRSQRRPLYSHDLMEQLRFGVKALPHPPSPERRDRLGYLRPQSYQSLPEPRGRYLLADWYTRMSPALSEMVLKLPERSEALKSTIQKFACVTPAVMATDMAPTALSRKGVEVFHDAKQLCAQDPFHEARMRLSIAFPDKRLLQYDCGKLQKLDALLRQLQIGSHRALIFTQMTKVLDILEQFLNIHGYRYLRLDGGIKIEQRQILTERFNNDTHIPIFILSSRSGGIGINLTGADTVIFYDMDWNPAMDRQCQDRAHRIGQKRDVHIYRLVSEHTIEVNILRKANQKRMLDDVVIQEGEFTTEYFNNTSVKDVFDDEDVDDANAAANAAMDRALSNRNAAKVFEAVEDREDVMATKEAEKEIIEDAQDFSEKGINSGGATPKTTGPPTPGELMPPPRRPQGDVEMTTTMEAAESGLVVPSAGIAEELEVPSCDDYMIRFLDWELKDIPVRPPVDKSKSKKKRGKESLSRKK